MRKTLAVCGDSFMSAVSSEEYGAESHFTQILAKKIDWDYITFARGGCGNSVIRLQIDEAIKIRPDLLIIGTTTPDRVEFPFFPIDRTNENFWEGVYDKRNGLSNICWSMQDLSYQSPVFKNHSPVLEAQTISNMINHPDIYLNGFRYITRNIFTDDYLKNVINIWKEYYIHCFDMNWKKQQDTWIIANGLYNLKKHNIKFFIIPQFMYLEDLGDFEENIVIPNTELDPWRQHSRSTKARFHTDIEAQYRLADRWFDFLVDKI